MLSYIELLPGRRTARGYVWRKSISDYRLRFTVVVLAWARVGRGELVMEKSKVQQEIGIAVSLLEHVFALKITDGFGIVDAPISSLIHAAAGGGRNKGFAERMAMKIEAGITITSRRPTRSSGTGQWLVIVPEILVAELLQDSDWEFNDCGGILSCIPGAVCGEANIDYLSFVKKRETISIPLAGLFEYFPQLKPVDRSPVRIPLLPTPLKTKLKPNQIAHVRRLRAGGSKVTSLAKWYGVTLQEIKEVTRTKLSKAERFRKLRGEPVLEPMLTTQLRQKRKPVPAKPKIPISRQERIRRMRSDGFRSDTLAKMFGLSVQEIDDVVASK